MFKGVVSPEEFARTKPGESAPETAIRDYGIGLTALWKGDRVRARTLFERQVRKGPWPSFATIAAEIELADLLRAEPDLHSPAATLDAWVLAWNTYDSALAARLFSAQPVPTYFSSEKAGRVEGAAALAAHHKGFGFVPGGKTSDARLWLEGTGVEERGDTAFATATWFFDRDVAARAEPQHGPVTFVLVKTADGWQISHAHFANDPPARR
jgi:ketosteroid isomerase-like protein